jgi:hypothetical protein
MELGLHRKQTALDKSKFEKWNDGSLLYSDSSPTSPGNNSKIPKY